MELVKRMLSRSLTLQENQKSKPEAPHQGQWTTVVARYWAGEEPHPQTPPWLLLESLLLLLLEMERTALAISAIYWGELCLSASPI